MIALQNTRDCYTQHTTVSLSCWFKNKTNLRDLIAATGLVISNWSQIVDSSACVTLKFDGWPKKTIRHIFYTMSSFVNHLKSIGEFKLELQSGNAQLGSILAIFFLRDIEIWWITLENNREPLLYYIKLCASFQSHGWIQSGVTVRKPSIRVEIGNFLSHVTLKFDRWPCKTIGHLSYAASSIIS